MLPGIQMSSFRPLTQTEAGMRQAFRRAAALGCGVVQLQWTGPSVPAENVARALADAGLTSVSVQDLFESVRADAGYYLRLNEATGGKWLCVSRIPERMKSPEGLERFIREMRELDEAAQRRGQKLCFHPVAADFLPVGGKGPVHEILSRMPLLPLCADLYHVARAGLPVPDWIGRHAGRIAMAHFKDEKGGRLVPAGSGAVCTAAAVRACLKANVAYGFAEQETWDGDPFACVGQGFDWLREELSSARRDAGKVP